MVGRRGVDGLKRLMNFFLLDSGLDPSSDSRLRLFPNNESSRLSLPAIVEFVRNREATIEDWGFAGRGSQRQERRVKRRGRTVARPDVDTRCGCDDGLSQISTARSILQLAPDDLEAKGAKKRIASEGMECECGADGGAKVLTMVSVSGSDSVSVASGGDGGGVCGLCSEGEAGCSTSS